MFYLIALLSPGYMKPTPKKLNSLKKKKTSGVDLQYEVSLISFSSENVDVR
jgi:hypothetical protein